MRVWRLDPPACDCRNICKNPDHDRPEWVEEPMTLVDMILEYGRRERVSGAEIGRYGTATPENQRAALDLLEEIRVTLSRIQLKIGDVG
mgnify:CR=1 FL=1